MARNIGIILSSKNPINVKNAIKSIISQINPFNRIFLVPWGNNYREVEKVALAIHNDIIIIPPNDDTSLGGNRNNALHFIKNNPPDWVAFIDDDTILHPQWLSEMLIAVDKFGNNYCFASLVLFENSPTIVQSAGHILHEARPHDRGFKNPKKGLCVSDEPLCPCGNSAFVPWSVIEKIMDIDNEIWDPNFKQSQTCFDFGLKLQLIKCKCQFIHSAIATHKGWMETQGELKESDVINQLRSRILRYDKFYPEKDRKEAKESLKNRIYGRWKKKGYPSGNSIKGEDVIRVYKIALEQEEKLVGNITDDWIKKMRLLDESKRRKLLF